VTENARAESRALLRSCPCAKAGNIAPTYTPQFQRTMYRFLKGSIYFSARPHSLRTAWSTCFASIGLKKGDAVILSQLIQYYESFVGRQRQRPRRRIPNSGNI
jgi:hypothetical protein